MCVKLWGRVTLKTLQSVASGVLWEWERERERETAAEAPSSAVSTADQTAAWSWGRYFSSLSHWQTKTRGLHHHSDTVSCHCKSHKSRNVHLRCSKQTPTPILSQTFGADLNMFTAFNARWFCALFSKTGFAKIFRVEQNAAISRCRRCTQCTR